MGKYKQWLHHQEIGRRLRDQINTLEQERGRVQQMAPDHPAGLPEVDNPIIAALASYTRSGNKLSNIDVVQAAMPNIGQGPVRPAANAAAIASAATPVSSEAVVTSLLARAEQMPTQPQRSAPELAPSRTSAPGTSSPSQNTEAPADDSVNSWWQRHQQNRQD